MRSYSPQLEVEGTFYEAGPGSAEVHVDRRAIAGCVKCVASSSCSTRLLASQVAVLKVPPSAELRPGQSASVHFPAGALLGLSFLFPLFAGLILLLASAGSALNGPTDEVGSIAGGMLGFALGSLLLRLYDSRSGNRLIAEQVNISRCEQPRANRGSVAQV